MVEVKNGITTVKPLTILRGTHSASGSRIKVIICEGLPRIDCIADYERFYNWIFNECYSALAEGGQVVIELPVKPKPEVIKDVTYWQRRCELAEKCIENTANDKNWQKSNEE